MPDGYFSAQRDREVVGQGGFFCSGCLVSKPLDDQSPDPRYCRSCYKFLLGEAALLPAKQKIPSWAPVSGRAESLPGVKKGVAKLPDKALAPVGVLQHGGGRPRKEGEVHRVTKWRREKQGTLI